MRQTMTEVVEVLLTALVIWGLMVVGGVIWVLWTSTRELKGIIDP